MKTQISTLQQPLFSGVEPLIPTKTKQKRQKVFKTEGLPESQIKKITFGAESQEVKILEFLQSRPNEALTASEVWHFVFVAKASKTLLTSVRRALNTLESDKKIRKLTENRESEFGYGVSETQWTAANKI